MLKLEHKGQKMKIRRWEDRRINVLVEYDINVDTIEEAVEELKIIDGSDKYYKTKKNLAYIDPNEVKDTVNNNEPMWIDDEDYWKAENEFGNWEEIESIMENNI